MNNNPEQVPHGVLLLPPCVAAYRYKMNQDGAVVLGGRKDDNDQLEPYAACAGVSDPFCEGGTLAWPPDAHTQQDEFAVAMAAICTARCWFWRTNNGKTVPVEKLGD